MDPRNILIVEDESIVRLHLRRIVEGMGHVVCGTASTADEAVAAAERTPPDLVLMDINLRGERDGIDAAQEIVDRRPCAVVFATAFADDRTLERTEAVGAVGYVLKPFGERAIRATLTTALREHDRLSAHRDGERSLNGILGGLDDAVIVTDAAARVTFLNPRARDLVEGGDDAVGRDVSGVLDPVEDEADAFRDALAAALDDGGSHRLPVTTLARSDGREVLVDGRVELLDGDRFLLTLKDLTDRWFRRTGGAEEQTQTDPRLVIYSHDTFGLGHLRRSLNLASALVERSPGLSVLIVTGSPVAHRYSLPPRVDYVKLPAVRKTSSDSYAPRTLGMSDDDVLTIRSNLILRTVRDFRPDMVLVDHSPAGMRGEMKPALAWLSAHAPGCRLVCGLRDIIDAPESVAASWRRGGVDQLLEECYDDVVVYGTEAFHDTAGVYGFSPSLTERTTYLGFVVEKVEVGDLPAPAPVSDAPNIVVTAGGGDGASEALTHCALDMIAAGHGPDGMTLTVIPGPLAPDGLVDDLRARADGLPVVVHDFVDSTSPFMHTADAVVSTGGYNTSMQLQQYAHRAVVVPRVMHRQEQLMRARRLEELGRVVCLHPDELTPERLGGLLRGLCSVPAKPLAEARDGDELDFGGARRLAEFCIEKLTATSCSREASYE